MQRLASAALFRPVNLSACQLLGVTSTAKRAILACRLRAGWSDGQSVGQSASRSVGSQPCKSPLVAPSAAPCNPQWQPISTQTRPAPRWQTGALHGAITTANAAWLLDLMSSKHQQQARARASRVASRRALGFSGSLRSAPSAPSAPAAPASVVGRAWLACGSTSVAGRGTQPVCEQPVCEQPPTRARLSSRAAGKQHMLEPVSIARRTRAWTRRRRQQQTTAMATLAGQPAVQVHGDGPCTHNPLTARAQPAHTRKHASMRRTDQRPSVRLTGRSASSRPVVCETGTGPHEPSRLDSLTWTPSKTAARGTRASSRRAGQWPRAPAGCCPASLGQRTPSMAAARRFCCTSLPAPEIQARSRSKTEARR
ncbi:hypothetical protein BC831DRAFT_178051 [Entophlyctis helioformis]|nr:hypothetical protein BC831DRAFT_178051 [Entophlyctis helioformis]